MKMKKRMKSKISLRQEIANLELPNRHALPKKKPTNDTPVLDNFGTDMTRAAEEGKLDPVVGRIKEIERLAQILSRRKKTILSSLVSQV